MKNLAILLACFSFLLTACGGQGDSAKDTEPNVADDYPACSDVWKVGEVLPLAYKDNNGCDFDPSEKVTVVDASYTPCKDERTALFVHQSPTGENLFFAITGQKVAKYDEAARSKAYDTCQPA